ncbi:MAG: universal stress protein [Defluviimonas sp.]|nr:universal stress protein [Defluviimonas sp.]
MTTYLVATDLSERGDRALQRAFDLAARNGAELVLTSVVDDTLPDDIAQRLSAEIAARLERMAAAIAATTPGTPSYRVDVRIADPAQAIAGLAAETGAALLMLGLHRLGGFDLMRDTTMQRVARMSPCPVLLVREPVDGPYRNVVAAIDFSPAAAAAVRMAAQIAPDARIRPVHAMHVPYKTLMARSGTAADFAPFRREAESARAAWHEAERLPAGVPEVEIVEGSMAEVISEALHREQATLLALGAHARSGFSGWLTGSHCTGLMRDPPCDLLIVRPGSA